MIYTACVALGVIAALLLARRLPRDPSVPPAVARATRGAALLGAVLGAYLFELPADLWGWAAAAEPFAHAGATPLGGRTVVGGLLGGWIAVELAKWRVGFRGATGDGFALPLAVGLAFGRMGCVLAGCCPGVPLAPHSPWAALSLVHRSPPRFPAALLEGYFHGVAAMVLVALARTDWLRGRRLALYLGCYAGVRFGLEFARANPRILLGLTYYQWLTVPLAVACGAVAWSRREVHSPRVRPEFTSSPS